MNLEKLKCLIILERRGVAVAIYIPNQPAPLYDKKIFFCEWVPTATVAEGKEGEQEERFWSLAPRFFFFLFNKHSHLYYIMDYSPIS